MPRATLLFNPAAGRAHLLRAHLPAMERILAAHGYTATLLETAASPHDADTRLRQAAERSELVLACGGDGTVHAAAQALAGSPTALGVIPLGTHNALANSLSLPRTPLAALARLLTFQPHAIPLGEIETPTAIRVFLLMAGCGPAGSLAAAMARPSRLKGALGRTAYPLHAARLLLTQRLRPFRVDYRLGGAAQWHTTEAVSLLVSRVPSLGGIFRSLTPHAALTNPHLHTHLLRAPAHLALPAWLARVPNPWLEVLDLDELRCTSLDATRPTLTQADAEPLGTLPCTMRVRPAALNLLLPPPA